ncbi:RidA family protein [Paraburkholderia nemoris]|uniref:RidA family protein n=1 Tax=Paraburkholderia TaxID=1822464 RepID=UPI000BC3BBCD|nr:Enamine deaminase RidA, house cleaning of reactive enamine intermediates, YjgF/YER057c/UK114 family [Burkholderia sp. OK233]
MSPEEKLVALGFELPPALPPRFSYIPYRQAGDLLFLAGHGPRLPDDTYRTGKISSDDQIPGAYADAQLTALNILATLKSAVGELSRIKAFIKVFGMVNAAPDFTAHPKVINGCSDLLVNVFDEVGRHARSAVGMASLPSNMTVEIEVIVQIAS